MATAQENLVTARDQIAARIVELTASANPDVVVAGRTINKSKYLVDLAQQLAVIEQAIQATGGPWEVRSWGC